MYRSGLRSTLLHMTFYQETLADLFCIAPSPVFQLIHPHHSFIPQALTEPLVSATHCTRPSVPVLMEHSVQGENILPSLPNAFWVGLLHSSFTCCVFMLAFPLEIFPQESLPQTPSNHLFFLFLRFCLPYRDRCSFVSKSGLF